MKSANHRIEQNATDRALGSLGDMRTNTNIRYVAEPKHVRELTLSGTADFGFWSDFLKAEGLAPVSNGDGAQVVIVAAEMVYFGLRFTEVSFSVRAALTKRSGSEGMRLLHAFTSNRVFAWCERTIFATPYGHGECHISVAGPPSVRLKAQGERVFSAEMSSSGRAPLRAADESWEGPVFLPPRGAATGALLFFGRLKGHTVAYEFSSGDRFAIEPSAAGGVLQPLLDSRFQPQEWVVRADATHGKSKTYKRTAFFAHDPPFDNQSNRTDALRSVFGCDRFIGRWLRCHPSSSATIGAPHRSAYAISGND